MEEIISLRNICQSYGDFHVFNGLNLTIGDKPNQGEFICILGISGSGKSTLLRYIAGLQKPTSGEVLINGKHRTDEHVSMVFQQYSSLPWKTVLENVTLPLIIKGKPKKEAAVEALTIIERVGLKGHEHKFAQYPILSGGQLQRVAIARSLIANPHILLMDEPFGALDGLTRLGMQKFLAELWLSIQSTIIFVTHDLREAVYLGDEVIILDPRQGKIGSVINIDLPLERPEEIKRTPRFIELVNEVEKKLIETGS